MPAAYRAQVYAFVAGDDKPFVVHLSSPTKFWEGLTKVVNKPELMSDERFASKEKRGKNYPALHAILSEVFKTQPRAHWLNLLLQHDVPSAPLNNFDDVFADPQVQHLNMRQTLPHKLMGSVDLVRNPLRMSATPPAYASLLLNWESIHRKYSTV